MEKKASQNERTHAHAKARKTEERERESQARERDLFLAPTKLSKRKERRKLTNKLGEESRAQPP